MGQAAASINVPIVAVVVTFNPDTGFAQRLQACLGQVESVVLVDNSTDSAARAWLTTGCITWTA